MYIRLYLYYVFHRDLSIFLFNSLRPEGRMDMTLMFGSTEVVNPWSNGSLSGYTTDNNWQTNWFQKCVTEYFSNMRQYFGDIALLSVCINQNFEWLLNNSVIG